MKQLFVPLLIVILLLGLFIPIPGAALDYLIILNVVLAVVLLFSVLLIDQPVRLTTIPSFLLILTLFRLVTNISTTRQILDGAEPGKIIPLIGELVIQGSVIIGLVIFGILTLVQLIVVTKGAERVAEVSARFTLDALPGKQMSIDADVRAGLIDFNEARNKRQETQVESRFYGALDGSMKFIKGDAIVGLLITAINLAGGFCTGLFIQHLTIQEAVSHYTLLTIGDGVITQIPAILNSIAAGILVTRVVSNDGSSLTTELVHQLFSHRGVQMIIILLSLLFACLPGIPPLPFSLIALLFAGFMLASQKKRDVVAGLLPSAPLPGIPRLLTIQISDQLPGISEELFSKHVQHDFYQETALIIGSTQVLRMQLQTDYQLLIRGEVLVKADFSDSEMSMELKSQEISRLLASYSTDLLDDRLTRTLVDLWEQWAPYQVSYLIPDQITLTRITKLLKDLMMEGIYPKNFDLIMQTIAENIDQKPTNLQLLSLIRQALRYQISRKYPDANVLAAITLDPLIDSSFFKAAHHGAGFNLAYLELIISAIKEVSLKHNHFVIICSAPIRRFLWECLRSSGLKIVVLAFEEIVPEVKIKSLFCVCPEKQPPMFSDQNLQLI